MGAEENREVIRSVYEAFDRGDLGAMRDVFAEDMVMFQAGRSVISGTFRGHDEIFAHIEQAAEMTNGTIRLSIVDILASDDHVAVILDDQMEVDGRRFAGTNLHVYTMKHGKPVYLLSVPDDVHALEQTFGRADAD